VRLTDGVNQQQAKEQLAEELKAQGHKPYIIGHRAAVLGAVAYVGCAVETHEQLTALGLKADVIALASGSGTQAGIALGVKALGMEARVLGFSPSLGDEEARHRATCQRSRRGFGLGRAASPRRNT
jgi:1-aminocyclopropane-1-carboxylate deaminase/D-cysteine desulfhydrase-like pyridoxal-dependent ACC family enzyme